MSDTKKFKRPEQLAGSTRRTRMGCGWFYCTINRKFDQPMEIFMRVGKAGACQGSLLQGLGRVVSIALQYGVPAGLIADTLAGISCPEGQAGEPGRRAESCLDALAAQLRRED